MRPHALALLLVVTGCNAGEPRGDDPIIGAWCVVDGGGAPVYFHRSRKLDDNGRGFPAYSWWRDSKFVLHFGDASSVDETDEPDGLRLSWEDGGQATLRRTEYVVVVDGGVAGPCDDSP